MATSLPHSLARRTSLVSFGRYVRASPAIFEVNSILWGVGGASRALHAFCRILRLPITLAISSSFRGGGVGAGEDADPNVATMSPKPDSTSAVFVGYFSSPQRDASDLVDDSSAAVAGVSVASGILRFVASFEHPAVVEGFDSASQLRRYGPRGKRNYFSRWVSGRGEVEEAR